MLPGDKEKLRTQRDSYHEESVTASFGARYSPMKSSAGFNDGSSPAARVTEVLTAQQERDIFSIIK